VVRADRREVVVLDHLLVASLSASVRTALDQPVVTTALAFVVVRFVPVFARAVEAVVLPPSRALGDRLADWIRGPPQPPEPSG
jgi:hypothetical protein